MLYIVASRYMFSCATSVKLLIRVSRVRTPGGALKGTDFTALTVGLVLFLCLQRILLKFKKRVYPTLTEGKT